MRNEPILPRGSPISTLMFLFFFRTGTRSAIGFSHQSISPFCNAAAAVAGSGMIIHSTRSTIICLPPASQEAFSCRGT